MKENASKSLKYIAVFLLTVYLFLLTYLTFFSSHYGRGIGLRGINIVPFSTIMQYLSREMGIHSIMVNLAGNIVAFMPMGFLLPLAFKGMKKFSRVITVSIFATVLIETLQYLTSSGISDVDDIILNLLGSVLGYLLLPNSITI
jgi:glycopeptide antibiotics resistance protein